MRAKQCAIFRQMIDAIQAKFDVTIVDPSTRQKVGASDDDEVIYEQIENFDIKWIKPAAVRDDVQKIVDKFWAKITEIQEETDRRAERMKHGDELPSGVLQMAKVYVLSKEPCQSATRWPDGTATRVLSPKLCPKRICHFSKTAHLLTYLLNPLGVPSRMNVGQILETHLGWVAKVLGFNAITPVFDGATEEDIQKLNEEANQLMKRRRAELEENGEAPS